MTSNSIPESPAIGATPALDYLGLAGLLVAAFFFGSVPARNPEDRKSVV